MLQKILLAAPNIRLCEVARGIVFGGKRNKTMTYKAHLKLERREGKDKTQAETTLTGTLEEIKAGLEFAFDGAVMAVEDKK